MINGSDNTCIAKIQNLTKTSKYKCTSCKTIGDNAEEYYIAYKYHYFCNSACHSKFVNYTITPYKHETTCCKCKKKKNKYVTLPTFQLYEEHLNSFDVPQELYDRYLTIQSLLTDIQKCKVYNHAQKKYPSLEFNGLKYSVSEYRYGYGARVNKKLLRMCVECYNTSQPDERIISGVKQKGYSKKIGFVKKPNRDIATEVTCNFCGNTDDKSTWCVLTKKQNKTVFCSTDCANLYILKG